MRQIRTYSGMLYLAIAGILSSEAIAQCANDNVLTGTVVNPACPGTTNITCVQGGQYALVNVVLGNTYTFSTCGATFDTQITLYNNAGGGSLGYNDDACGLQSTVNWTATFTGALRVLIDQYFCANGTTCAPLQITCASPPAGDCIYTLTLYDSFSDGWGTSFVGVSINGGPFQNYTLAAGAPSIAFQIGVYIGDVIVLNYDASGTWQTDNSYILSLAGSGVYNSGSPPAAGISYSATVDCVPPPAAQEDCIGALAVCSNVAFGNNTNNTGNIADINATNSGCLDIVEYQGTWYIFSPSSSGDLGVTIAPQGPDDYDWAVWGPYPSGTTPSAICPPSGPPIRCAASSGPATFSNTGSYATGMGHPTFSPPQFASTAVTYGIPATFNVCPLVAPQRCGWVPGMQVIAGQVFLMYISNWSQSSTGFDLSWTLANGASLDCTVLPIELISFNAFAVSEGVKLEWATSSESNNDRFEIERGADGNTFERIGSVPGVGNSMELTNYAFLDGSPIVGMNFYRLRQVDINGAYTYSPVRSVFTHMAEDDLLLIPNPGSSLIEVRVPGIAGTAHFVMLDATGREVIHEQLNGSQTFIDVSQLPAGLYGTLMISTSGEIKARGTWLRE